MIFKDISHLSSEEMESIINRNRTDFDDLLIGEIITSVREKGDAALRAFTKRFDGVYLGSFQASEEEFSFARNKVRPVLARSIKKACERIYEFHEQLADDEKWVDTPNSRLGQIIRPIGSVGCYVPGGRAFYPSTVLMNVVPAKVAGVNRVVVVTPPSNDGAINEHTLYACEVAGVDEVYKVGGAQAIAALAFGTETIEPVDLIVGPGNVFVTAAKKAVYGQVGIDMLAGPSEILIIADGTAKAEFIASDVLAQAEHDPRASCVLITTDMELAKEVYNILDKVRSMEALENTYILTVDDLVEAVSFSNRYAPEHLEIITSDDEAILNKINNAGSIFLGNYSPVAAGDYASGPNHVLPTSGCARFQSGLGVGHFQKKISVQRLEREGLREIGSTVTTLADAEGLKYHSESVKKRLK